MIDLNYLLAEPKPFKNYMIYPPTVDDILKNPKAISYAHILTQTQGDIDTLFREDKIAPPTPFEYLLSNCYNSDEAGELILEAFQFFIKEPVIPFYEKKAFLIGSTNVYNWDDIKILTEDDFFDFQNEIRAALGDPLQEHDEDLDAYAKMDPRLRRMKARRREAERVKNKRQNETGQSVDFSTVLTAIFSMGLGITPLNVREISYSAIMSIKRAVQEKEAYDNQIRIMTSGFGTKKHKQPVYWINSLQQNGG